MFDVQVLRQHGVRVLTVREILAYNVAENISARVDLEGMAFSAMTYTMELGTKVGGRCKVYLGMMLRGASCHGWVVWSGMLPRRVPLPLILCIQVMQFST